MLGINPSFNDVLGAPELDIYYKVTTVFHNYNTMPTEEEIEIEIITNNGYVTYVNECIFQLQLTETYTTSELEYKIFMPNSLVSADKSKELTLRACRSGGILFESNKGNKGNIDYFVDFEYFDYIKFLNNEMAIYIYQFTNT